VDTHCENTPDSNHLAALRSGSIVFGKYRIVRLIGEGGMGSVFEVVDLNLNKHMALKVLTSQVKTPQTAMRFQNEARNASRVSHFAIAQTNDFGVTADGSAYMAVELVDGESLRARVDRLGCLSLPDFVSVFQDLCAALKAAHKASIIHRDLKPENIMVFTDDQKRLRAKLLDFGISKRVDLSEEEAYRLTRAGQVIGTPLFMSPEQASGERVDSKSDFYSLGCVMYFSLAGEPPFRGDTAFDTLQMHLESDPPDLTETSSGASVPEPIEHLIYDLMSKNPDARPVSEVEKILLEVGTELSEIVPPKSIASDVSPVSVPLVVPSRAASAKKSQALIWCAALVLVSFGVGRMFFFSPNSPRSFKTSDYPIATSETAINKEKRKAISSQLSAHNGSINLASMPINDTDMKMLENCTDAVEVHLESTAVTAAGLAHLRKCSDLRKLALGDTKVESLNFVSQFPNLKELDLTGTNIEDDDLRALKNARLAKLRLVNTNVTVAGIRQLKDSNLEKSSIILKAKMEPHDKGISVADLKSLVNDGILLVNHGEANTVLKNEAKRFENLKDLDSADRYWATVGELIPAEKPGKIAETFFHRAKLLKENENLKKQRILLEAAVRKYREDQNRTSKNPSRKYALACLIRLNIKEKRYAEVEGLQRELLGLCNTSTQEDQAFLFEQEKLFGRLYQHDKRFAEALRCFELARTSFQANGSSAEVEAIINCLKGCTLQRSGHYEEALAKYLKAIDIAPKLTGNIPADLRNELYTTLTVSYIGAAHIYSAEHDMDKAKEFNNAGRKFNDTFFHNEDLSRRLEKQREEFSTHR
jgi:serine/threonine protein kinase